MKEQRRSRRPKGEVILLYCDECGDPFYRERCKVGGYYDFCCKTCQGTYAGKHYGFRIYPENRRAGLNR